MVDEIVIDGDKYIEDLSSQVFMETFYLCGYGRLVELASVLALYPAFSNVLILEYILWQPSTIMLAWPMMIGSWAMLPYMIRGKGFYLILNILYCGYIFLLHFCTPILTWRCLNKKLKKGKGQYIIKKGKISTYSLKNHRCKDYLWMKRSKCIINKDYVAIPIFLKRSFVVMKKSITEEEWETLCEWLIDYKKLKDKKYCQTIRYL